MSAEHPNGGASGQGEPITANASLPRTEPGEAPRPAPYEVTLEDWAVLQRQCRRGRIAPKLFAAFVWLGGLGNVAFGLLYIAASAKEGAPFPLGSLVSIAVGAALILFYYFRWPWLLKRSFRTSVVHGQLLRVALDGGDLSVRTPGSKGRYEWSAILSRSREAGLMMFWVAPFTALMVPERAFASEAEAERFWRLTDRLPTRDPKRSAAR